MEEMEDPTERAQEELHEHAHEAKEPWIAIVALASAIIAALAAVTSLQAGHHANEAMIDQMKSADDWNHYQAKSIKAAQLGHHLDLMEYQILASPPAGGDVRKAELAETLKEKRDKLAEYKKDQTELEARATEEQDSSKHHMEKHQRMAYGVTMFQVAIAIAAICVLTRRFHYFMVTVGFAVAGIGFLVWGLVT